MTTLFMSKIHAAVVVAALATVSVAQALHAQSPTELGKVTVPFAFQAGIVHFAPGVYTISISTNGFLSIRGASASGLTMVMRDGGNEQSAVSHLVFHQFGNRYFLSEVSMRWNSVSFSCPQSRAERQAKWAQHAADRTSIAAPTDREIALLEGPR